MTKTLATLLLVTSLASSTAWAQADAVTTPPPNLVLANYNSTSVGPYGGLEGTAFVARVGDPSAAWFNPAGLARHGTAQISGSAGVYQMTSVSPEALPNQGGSIQQLPNYVGFTFVPRPGLTVGAALLNTVSWDQETDAEIFAPSAGGQQRFAYSAGSEFEHRVAAVSAGYQTSGSWRFGGGFAFSMLDMDFIQSASNRIADTSLRSLLVASRASGSAFQLRAQGGAQYDTGSWRFGGAIRTPGAMLHKSGTAILEGVNTGTGSSGASLFDPDADLEVHLPWEFQAGGAFVNDRLELEIDLQAFTAIDAYSLLSSDHPVLVYSASGASGAPVVTSSSFPGLTSASDGVVNVGAGGHVRLFKNRDLRLHAGVGVNQSPVASEDKVFTRIDLTTWSLGLSGTLGRFQFSAGANSQTGTADVTLRNLLDGQQVTSSIDVKVIGFIYSLAYRF